MNGIQDRIVVALHDKPSVEVGECDICHEVLACETLYLREGTELKSHNFCHKCFTQLHQVVSNAKDIYEGEK